MEEQGIHYRVGGKLTHCGCECLPGGRDIQYIVISHIEYKESEDIGGRRENNVWIAHFAPNPYTKLPMILNATNRKRLFKLYPDCNGYINLLKNIPVRLTREKCRDAQDGGDTWGLRISKTRPTLPPQNQAQAPAHAPAQPSAPAAPAQPEGGKVEITPSSEMFNQAIKFVKEGGDIEKIKAKYAVSPEVEAAIVKKAQEE